MDTFPILHFFRWTWHGDVTRTSIFPIATITWYLAVSHEWVSNHLLTAPEIFASQWINCREITLLRLNLCTSLKLRSRSRLVEGFCQYYLWNTSIDGTYIERQIFVILDAVTRWYSMFVELLWQNVIKAHITHYFKRYNRFVVSLTLIEVN